MKFKKIFVILWFLSLSLGACNFSATEILISTATPSLTPSPSPTPSLTPTITPTPMPTIIPLAQVSIGEKALTNGDYDLARSEFMAVLNGSSDEEMRAAALWGLIRVNYEAGNYHEVLAFKDQLLREYPKSPFMAYGYFLAGMANAKINRFDAAAESYASYLNLRPGLLANYVEELRGDAFTESKNYANAQNAYQAALLAPSLRNDAQVQIKIATSKAALGDFAGALADYQSIANQSNNDYVKARMDYLSGYAHLMLGNTEEGYAHYLHAVENYPLAYDSYISLVALVAADIPVDDFDRGLVDYSAKQYDVALVAFNHYIAENPEGDGGAQYYRAKTLYALGKYEDEVTAWEDFIENYPAHPYWAEAWGEKSYTQWHDLKELAKGKETLLNFVHTAPSHTEAADFLMRAARLMERNDNAEEAITLWLRLAEEYPGSHLAPNALFLAGITSYRLDDYPQAITLFQRELLLATESENKARIYFWIGKTQQKLNKNEDAQDAWRQAQSADPSGYYSERARDLLDGREPFSSPIVYLAETDSASELAEASSWLRITFGLPAETNLEDLGHLADDLRLQRGREFWELGLYGEARTEFENLRVDVEGDAADSFRLLNYMHNLGLYRPAIFAARHILDLAGMKTHAETLYAPVYFNHIRYGKYFSDLVDPIAEANGLHPLFVYSVMRQESLFEKFIHSAADARGLMQIIPGTGANLASLNGYPSDYREDDLYRPIISVKFGVWYLASNRILLDNDLYATLAAYNGGPGNAIEWQTLGKGDPDLMLESIRFAETREYLKSIYETFVIYEGIYQ